MKFYTTNSTGDSGLLYLGYWINQNFGFPFRVMTADIGIDAEIELLGENLASEGIIVKAQVKSTQSAITSNFIEYVDKSHLDYWNKLTVPVIYFKVDLENSKIYYKTILLLDDVELTASDDDEKWKINFDIENDLLDLSCKQKWLDRFAVVEYHNINSYIEILNKGINSVVITNRSFIDNQVIDNLIEKLDSMNPYFEKLDSLNRLYPWKFGDKLKEMIEDLKDERNSKLNFLEQEQQSLNYD